MKNIVLMGMLVLLVSCGGVSYQTRVDATNGFEIDYPSNWDTSQLDPRMNFMAFEDFEDSLDVFGERFNISVYPHGGIALDVIVDQNITMARQFYGNLQIDQQAGENENGIEYIQLRMPYNAEELDLVNRATFIANDKYLYTVTQIAEADKFEDYLPVFDHIINSFNWVE